MGEFLPISAAPRLQIFFSQDLLSDEEASELSSFIGEFHRDTRQRPPKTNKHKSFREWITRAREMSSNEMWSIFFTYLADDCVCFVDDRERIVNQREGSIRRWHRDKKTYKLEQESLFRDASYRKLVRSCCVVEDCKKDQPILNGLVYVTKVWKDEMWCCASLYPNVSLEWALPLLYKIAKLCQKMGRLVSENFLPNDGNTGESASQRFQLSTRNRLEEIACRGLTDEEYEAMIEIFLPRYCYSEGRRQLEQPSTYLPTLNREVWQRYQFIKETQYRWTSCIVQHEKEIISVYKCIRDYLSKTHKVNLEEPSVDNLPEVIVGRLQQMYSGWELADAIHFCRKQQELLNRFDPFKKYLALIWFIYLEKGSRRLQNKNADGKMNPIKLLGHRFDEKKYSYYKETFFALLKAFPPHHEYAVIQKEIFLLATGLFKTGSDDEELHDLPIVRTYHAIRKLAERQCDIDPAILWTLPWEKAHREEYEKTGKIRDHVYIYNWIRENKRFIYEEEKRLERSLKSYFAKEEDLLDAIYEATQLRQGSIYKDSIPVSMDPTLSLNHYLNALKIPGRIPYQKLRLLRPCVREYIALSIYRKKLSEDLVNFGFDCLSQMLNHTE